MKIFFDNNTSPVLAQTINGYAQHLGDEAHHIGALPCGRDATDFDWMAYLVSTGEDWLVVSGDGRLYKNKAERLAYRQARLKGLVLTPSYQKTPINQQASFLMWRWPEVLDLITRIEPPFLFEVPMARTSKFRPLPV